MGPLISRDKQRRFERAVRMGLAQGATLCVGGETPCVVEGKAGHWATPTLFRDVRPGTLMMRALDGSWRGTCRRTATSAWAP